VKGKSRPVPAWRRLGERDRLNTELGLYVVD
jgi:hypothetical protein